MLNHILRVTHNIKIFILLLISLNFSCGRPEIDIPTKVRVEFLQEGNTLPADIVELRITGESVSEYRVKYGESTTVDCSVDESYSDAIPIDEVYTLNLTQMVQRRITLCAIGKDSNGAWQEFEVATTKELSVVLNEENQPVALEIIPNSIILSKDSVVKVSVFGITSIGTSINLTSLSDWYIDNLEIADLIIDSEDLSVALNGKASGVTVLQSGYENLSTETSVFVTDAKLIGITPSSTEVKLPEGQQVSLTIKGAYDDGAVVDITSMVEWKSLHEGIVEIVSSGLNKRSISGKNVGDANVVVTFQEQEALVNIEVTDATLESIQIQPTSVTLAKGTGAVLKATGLFSDGSTLDITSSATWVSNDSSVVEVTNVGSNKGFAQGKLEGSTKIQVQSEGISASLPIVVTSAFLTEIDISPEYETIVSGLSTNLVATGILSDGTIQNMTSLVEWSSSDVTIASSSNDPSIKGKVTGLSSGTADITAIYNDIEGSASITVTSPVVTNISVSPGNTSVTPLGQQQFVATAHYNNGTNSDITEEATWSSSNEIVATVDNSPGNKGLSRGISVGTALIIAEYEDFDDQANLDVGL